MLAALALGPLAALGWMTWLQVDQHRSNVRGLDAIAEHAEQLGLLTDLEASVVEERLWAEVGARLAELGLSDQLVESATGFSVTGRVGASVSETDRSAEALGDPEVVALIGAWRESRDSPSPEVPLSSLSRHVEQRRATAVTGIRSIPVPTTEDPLLAAFARAVELAAERRAVFGSIVTDYALMGIPQTGPFDADLSSLATRMADYSAYTAELVELGSRHGLSVETSDDATNHLRSIIEASIGDPALVDAMRRDLSPDRISELRTVSLEAQRSAVHHTASLEDLTADLEGHLRATRAASLRTSIRTAALAAMLAILVMLCGTVATIWFVRPLTEMETMAAAMLGGGSAEPVVPRGPREICTLGAVLDGANAHLALMEQQALAIASGRLDDEVLDTPPQSELGRSLRSAVGRLRAAAREAESRRAELDRIAHTDELTGLSNRRVIEACLRRRLGVHSRSAPFAIVMIDLDDFKIVNDSYGHHIGDGFLIAVGQRLVRECPSGSVVARTGGDEFIAIVEERDPTDLAALSARIVTAMQDPMKIHRLTLQPSASVGTAIVRAPMTIDDAFRCADAALYEAKRAGRGRAVHFGGALEARVRRDKQIADALRTAVSSDGLHLLFQPIVNTGTGRVMGAEALLRWSLGDGTIEPEEFLRVAEESDLVLEIDHWVLEAALGELARWKNDPWLRSLRMSVNISARQLQRGGLAARLGDLLLLHQVDPRNLVIELTEDGVVHDFDQAAAEVRAVRDIGIAVSIDDFGSGNASIGHLRALPVDVVKVDRSLIADLDCSREAAFVRLIVETAHVLGMSVVVEGVETLEQLRILQDHIRPDALQGFVLGRPMTVSELSEAVDGERSVRASP